MENFIINLAGLMTIFLGCFAFMGYFFTVSEKKWESKLDQFDKKLDYFGDRIKDIIKDQDAQRARMDKLFSALIDILNKK